MSSEKRKIAYIDGKPYEIGSNHNSILKFVRSYVGEKKVIFDKNRAELYEWYKKANKDSKLFMRIINSAIDDLEKLFSSKITNAEKLQKKQKLFDELRENYQTFKDEFRVLSYDNWFKKDLNNTHLLGVKRYHSKVEQFKRLFVQQGKDWKKFLKVVRELSEKSPEERNRRLSLLN